MSLMDRFNVLSQSAKDMGIDKAILVRTFAGSTMEAFDNGSEISDVICWDEDSQSAVVFLNKDWNVLDFSWADENAGPDWEWRSNPELAGFFASCISYAREHGIPLDEVGCDGADSNDCLEDVDCPDEIPGSIRKNLLNELRQTLEDNNCFMDDIAYAEVMSRDGRLVCISPAIFTEMASEIDYVDGSMCAAIHPDLKVVLKDGSFVGRMRADGSEWFRFWKRPDVNPEMANLGRDDLCFFSHEAL